MKVKDLMSSGVICIREDTSVLQAATHMRKNNIGCLPVCDDIGHLKGIVTDRDIVLRVLARFASEQHENTRDARISHIKASDIMSTSPISVSPETGIHDAALLFSAHKIRRLPVTEAGRIVGMLSLGDVAVKPVHIDEAGDALSAISSKDGMPAES